MEDTNRSDNETNKLGQTKRKREKAVKGRGKGREKGIHKEKF